MKRFVVLLAALSIPPGALAQSTAGHEGHHPAEIKIAQAAAPKTEGEVRKVDKDAQKMTIKHGPITNLDMPGMTMVFRVKDPAMLEQVKPGDKIRFSVEKVGGAFTVTELEAAP